MKHTDEKKKQPEIREAAAAVTKSTSRALSDDELDLVNGGIGLSMDVVINAVKLVGDLKDKAGMNKNGPDEQEQVRKIGAR